jgi:hypothetical protein
MNERDEVIEAIDCIVDSVMCGCEPVEQRQTLLGIFDRTMEMRDHYRQQREGLSSRADYWELRTRETKAELATAESALAAERAEVVRLTDVLQFVERWANHHAQHPRTTAAEALGVIQHHPSITAITKSYADGVVPNTPNPWAELAEVRARLAEAEKDAGRYRYLRDDQDNFSECRWDSRLIDLPNAEFDAAIDAARAQQHGGGDER